ncbi:MAG TPA: hypothetical protein VE780_00410 [Thermoleophilaceae bacterium]|nr:hypothetical protein [Thermoleophilaceae bacterium]
MSSRQAQKERLRKERLERERRAAEAAARKRRLLIGGGVAAVVAAVAVVVVLVAGGGGSGSAKSSASNGLLTTRAPWPAVKDGLPQRAAALGLPQPSDTIYHVHARLRVYVDGKPVTVPANIGIDPSTGFLDSLHTHDTTGIIHMEAVRPYNFTLGQFFTVWGVKFTSSQLGAYKVGGGKVLAVYANGKKVANPTGYAMKAHDNIVVGYGRPGSFPTRISGPFPAGL